MADLAVAVTGLVEGDDLTLTFEITNIPSGDSLDEAYFTVKTDIDDADPGLIQKVITTSNVAGTGQITDDGASDQEGTVRVDITADDSALPTPGTPVVFDLQVYTVNGITNTPYIGTITTVQGVTDATLA